MKLYVKTQGKTVGPLDWDRILVLHENGRLSVDATVSEDKVTWLTIEQVKQLVNKGSDKSDKSSSLSIAGEPSLPPSGLRVRQELVRQEEDIQSGYMPPPQPNIPQPQQSGYYMPPQQLDMQQSQQSGYYMPPQQSGGQYSPQQVSIQQNPTGQPMMNQYRTILPPADKENKSTTALVCGIISLVMWLLPIIGLPLSIVGLCFGCKNKYKVGITLNIIGLVLSIVNAIVGAVLGAQGKLF